MASILMTASSTMLLVKTKMVSVYLRVEYLNHQFDTVEPYYNDVYVYWGSGMRI